MTPPIRVARQWTFSRVFFPVLLLAMGIGLLPAHAQTSPIGTRDFTYNNTWTTRFGPAAADIVVTPSNMLACKPPASTAPNFQNFSYALCFYSGPAVPTGLASAGNSALPCVLSADGQSANCTCYKLTAAQYPSQNYLVDINGILNLNVYNKTVAKCSANGDLCSKSDTSGNPACEATNTGTMMPTGSLISVYSTLLRDQYIPQPAGQTPMPSKPSKPDMGANTTICPAAKYAGCMTAPCVDNGQKDSKGNALVQCLCPVVTGPYEVGQGGMQCDANAMTLAGTGGGASYVWSASHNPLLNPAKDKAPAKPR